MRDFYNCCGELCVGNERHCHRRWKRAMLPGVFVGTILAWFSGGEIRENFWIIAAAGLMGMTFGGIETYGETIGMVLHRGTSDYKPIKGYTGLAVKGALWFSLCGGFIAFAFSAMSGKVYSTADIIIFCCSTLARTLCWESGDCQGDGYSPCQVCTLYYAICAPCG